MTVVLGVIVNSLPLLVIMMTICSSVFSLDVFPMKIYVKGIVTSFIMASKTIEFSRIDDLTDNDY